MDCYRCSICLEFVATSIELLIRHVGRVHRNEPNFHVVCGIDGCSRTYKRYLSLRNHLIRKHNISACDKPRLDENNGQDHEDHDDNDDVDRMNDEDSFDIEKEKANLMRANALCLLNFKEKGRIPQTVVNSFVENTTQITENTVHLVKSGIAKCLQEVGLNINQIPGLSDVLDENSGISKPFQGIDKEPLQYQYYKEHFNLVVSCRS